ncbi:D-alanyl-D-alanine carboxypeptidase/D-alanyl-D-alanine endopeptidase [Pseudodonghicola flavimaris]|uniref:D-alanyl-D-alanine carboxypeptidase/D-alanyl-D-alanine-endopeptidase n=1 Tax=Pseudodonghicola flavimaris TaxID=3050036 RepID=A0ABT7F4T1_9RHOB|nr:D-alanyl-D-alanine carboxypeptidase/D-alanyl-D-alanine-endopeptidase [Pseudodonghicola flavimaris]MDK3019621.1 D-alanyl-D-alanine carboxypeptidase/D-alanyl-D-alanine-endopeptidase [Pseudodonghicola flavimaris]
MTTDRVSRRQLLGTLAAAVALPAAATAGPPAVSLRPHLRAGDFAARAAGGAEGLIARSGLPGEVVCAVADPRSGKMLESVQGSEGLPPASVAKILTTLYALERLGPDYRFATRLIATGPVQNGVLQGDLVLAGGGDPTLSTDDLARMAAELKAAGVREVRGRFRVYDGVLPFVQSIDESQPAHLGYSPAVSGIALNFNRVHFQWAPAGKGYSVAMDARSDRYRPEVAMARMRIANRQLPVYTYADRDGIDDWTVARAALGKGGSRWLPVRKPAAYTGDVFRTLARAYGVVLPAAQVGRSLPGGTVLITHQSDALRDVLRLMLKYSNNLTAEMVGMTASASGGKTPDSLRASAAEMNRWAADRLGMSNTRMVDHSGLGDASRMTAGDLVSALVQVRRQNILRPLLKPFPMRDARGRIMQNHPIKVDAKTGTLNFVSGLGGFLTAPNGRELAFAIFTADPARRARSKDSDQEIPQGARSWNRKSKALQQQLIERWSAVYAS